MIAPTLSGPLALRPGSTFPVGVRERLFHRLGSPPGVIEFATRPSEQSTSELPVAFRFAPSVLEPSIAEFAGAAILVTPTDAFAPATPSCQQRTEQ